MKTIFETFKKSIYNPAFYKKVEETTFSEVITYYAKFTLFLTVVMVVVLSAFIIPRGVVFVKERAPYLVHSYYPQELTVTLEKGVASANVEMPYFIPLKELSKDKTPTATKNMLVVDTTKEFDKATFEEYSTYALLTRTDIVTKDPDGAITIQPLRGVSTTIDQEVLMSWVMFIQNSLWWISIFGIVVSIILIFSGYLLYLIPIIIFALIPKLVAYLKKTKISHATAYKISLYAIVPALALKTLLNILGVFYLPAYFTLLVFALIIVINMREMEQPTLFENNK